MLGCRLRRAGRVEPACSTVGSTRKAPPPALNLRFRYYGNGGCGPIWSAPLVSGNTLTADDDRFLLAVFHLGTLVYSYCPRHTQNIMKPANVRENARNFKGYTEPRDADRCLLFVSLILQCGHDEARVNTVSRRRDVCMEHPFRVRFYVGGRIG